MKIEKFTRVLESKLFSLVEKYDLNHHVVPCNKVNLDDFKSIVTSSIRNLLPKDKFLFLDAKENIDKKQYEILLKINSKDCVFRSTTDDESLGLAFWDQIYMLPRFSNFDIELYGVSNEFGLCDMDVCFISGDKVVLREAYKDGLPIIEPSYSFWHLWLDFKKIDNSKMFYLYIDLNKSFNENELKQLFTQGVNSDYVTKKIPTISNTQLEVVDLSANQIKRRFPFLEDPLEFEFGVTVFLNGSDIQSSLLVTKSGMYLRGRFADYFWAYGVVKKYNTKVQLIPYTNNPDLPKVYDSAAFFSWINSRMKDYPELNTI